MVWKFEHDLGQKLFVSFASIHSILHIQKYHIYKMNSITYISLVPYSYY